MPGNHSQELVFLGKLWDRIVPDITQEFDHIVIIPNMIIEFLFVFGIPNLKNHTVYVVVNSNAHDSSALYAL